MQARYFFTAQSRALGALSVLSLLVVSACPRNFGDPLRDLPPPTADVASLVDSHSEGTLPAAGDLKVKFHKDASSEVAPDALWSFKPQLEGHAYWDGRTLVFDPASDLPRGTAYEAEVDLAELGGKDKLRFTFTAMPQGFTMRAGGVDLEGKPRAGQPVSATLMLETSDVAERDAVESMLRVEGAEGVTIGWTHNQDGRSHQIKLTGLKRAEADFDLTVIAEGTPLGVENTARQRVRIPGVNSFNLLSTRAIQEGGRHIEMRFSDALDEEQELAGLVRVKGQETLRFVPKDNVLKVFPQSRFENVSHVEVAAGVKNAAGYKLKAGGKYEVRFERLKPAVRFVGKGNIVPRSAGLVIPVETANLRRLTVQALEVHNEALPQFFQVNNVGGDSELKRVGRVIWKKKVDLGDADGLRGAWTKHGLDLTELVKGRDADMVRLVLSFDRSDVLFQCDAKEDAMLPPRDIGADDALGNWDDEGPEASNWGTYEGDYWQNYERRKDPCHPSYYRHWYDHDVASSRNFLMSDVGLIAKRGAAGEVDVFVTDLRSSNPSAGAEVKLLDYQQTVVARGRTNAAGRATLEPTRKPFLIIAKVGGERGYLRVPDGEALSVAHFDTGGQAVVKGLKGYFYGERGVWRPGDDIFLTFVLQDRSGSLPASHPLHFALTDPQGRLIEQQMRHESNDGFFVFKVRTAHDAPTGNYTASVKVGGASFKHVLKIEAVVPNRLKIEMTPSVKVLKNGEDVEAELFSQWLHGAKADGLRYEVEARLLPKKTSFERYPEHTFDDPTRRARSQRFDAIEGTLDSEGKAKVTIPLTAEGRPAGMLNTRFTTRVFEPSGAFSIDGFSTPYSPYDAYVGVRVPKGDRARGMLLTDTKHPVDLVMVDDAGKPLNGRVKVRLYKINWRWWWETGPEELADYAGSTSYTSLSEGIVDVKNGKGKWELEIKYPDWGRYLVMAEDLGGGHRAARIFYADWPGWAGRAQKDNPGGASVLSLTTDKQEVSVGESLTVTVPGAAAGRALLTVESGSRVLSAQWVKTTKKATQVKLAVTSEMSPNIYVHVALIQPHLHSGNDLPMRMYGVVPVKVVDPKTRLKPILTVPEAYRPGGVAEVSVSEATGREMTYTLAIVDEGLLGLTRYGTPTPWDHFYAREALGVKTWDLFDDVAGALGGKLDTLLAIGGDGAGDGKGKRRVDRFPPMVRFAGPFSLFGGETKAHKIQLGPYVGQVRVMVVAGREGEAFGSASEQVFVRSPLMVQPTLPRIIRPGEKIALPVQMFVMDESIKSVEVEVEVTGPAKIAGKSKQTLKIAKVGDQIVPFELLVEDAVGPVKVKVTARGGGKRAEQFIEVMSAHPGTRVTRATGDVIPAGKRWDTQIDAFGVAGTNRGSVELSRVPPLDLERRLEYLIRYPHGCVEQTTSSVFPQLYLPRLVELSDAQRQKVQSFVASGIDKLRGYQQRGGGFGYWPSDAAADDWSSSYVGHFLLEAKRAGWSVDGEVLDNWRGHQTRSARAWRRGGDHLTQAYRLYTLALAGSPSLAEMNRLREVPGLKGLARARLAAAYQLASQPQVARTLVEGVALKPGSPELGGTFRSDVRDQAMLLEVYSLLGDDARAAPLAKDVSKALTDATWLNTHATAYALIALARFGLDQGSGTLNATVTGPGGERSFNTDKALVRWPLDLTKGKSVNVVVTNNGSGPLFARVLQSGLPKMGEEKELAQGLTLAVEVLAVDDGKTGARQGGDKFTHGGDFLVRYRVKNTTGRKLENLALTATLPAGMEIRNERLHPGAPRSARFDYQDVRDDRVLTYFGLDVGEERTLEVRANAAYAGSFYWPGGHVEAMYDAAISAHTTGRMVTLE